MPIPKEGTVPATDEKEPVEPTTETKADDEGFVDPLPDLDKEIEEEGKAEPEKVEEDKGKEKAEKPEAEELKESSEDPKPTERPTYSMPVSKAQEEKKKAVEKAREEARDEAEAEMQKLREKHEQELKSASTKSGDPEFDVQLKEVAEKHGLDPTATKDLLDVFQSKIKMPDMSKYDKIVKDQEIEGHKVAVSKEFDEKVAPLITKDFPQATPEHIRAVKARIEELAFTEGYNTYKLEDIYAVKRSEFEFKNSMSAEMSGGRGSELVEFRKLSDEEEIALSENDFETYKKYLKWEASQESQYIDN